MIGGMFEPGRLRLIMTLAFEEAIPALYFNK